MVEKEEEEKEEVEEEEEIEEKEEEELPWCVHLSFSLSLCQTLQCNSHSCSFPQVADCCPFSVPFFFFNISTPRPTHSVPRHILPYHRVAKLSASSSPRSGGEAGGLQSGLACGGQVQRESPDALLPSDPTARKTTTKKATLL